MVFSEKRYALCPMTPVFWGWLLGGLATATIGGIIPAGFSGFIRAHYKIPKPKFRETVGEVPAELTGLVERVVFGFLVAVDAPGYAPAMIAWLALKLAASWTWPEFEAKDASFEEKHRVYHTMRKSRVVSMLYRRYFDGRRGSRGLDGAAGLPLPIEPPK